MSGLASYLERDEKGPERGLFDTISQPPPHPFPLNDAIFIQQNVLVLAKWNDRKIRGKSRIENKVLEE
jgi:hypothetical protein